MAHLPTALKVVVTNVDATVIKMQLRAVAVQVNLAYGMTCVSSCRSTMRWRLISRQAFLKMPSTNVSGKPLFFFEKRQCPTQVFAKH